MNFYELIKDIYSKIYKEGKEEELMCEFPFEDFRTCGEREPHLADVFA
jgi:hypothetical protein